MPSSRFSFGECAAGQCVSISLAEPRHWNRSLWVRELNVAGAHQRRGVGRQLVDALTEKARAVGLRTIVSGTQNTNIPAIRVYRRVGFHIEGIDLSYYSNDDYPDGEIALFMKKGSCRRIFPSIMLNERRTKFDHYLTRHDAYAAWGNIIEQIAVREKVSNYLLENQR